MRHKALCVLCSNNKHTTLAPFPNYIHGHASIKWTTIIAQYAMSDVQKRQSPLTTWKVRRFTLVCTCRGLCSMNNAMFWPWYNIHIVNSSVSLVCKQVSIPFFWWVCWPMVIGSRPINNACSSFIRRKKLSRRLSLHAHVWAMKLLRSQI